MPPRIVDFHGVRHSFPADFTDDDVANALDQYSKMRVAKIKSKLPQLQQQAQQAQSGWDRQSVPQQIVQGGVRALPTIGGTLGAIGGGIVGGAAGTPADLFAGPLGTLIGGTQGATRGALLGGSAGRALEEAIGPAVGLPNERAKTPLQAAGDIAGSGVGQAAIATGPEIALGAAKHIVAPAAMRTALGSWGARVGRAAETALNTKIGPGVRWWKAPQQLQSLIQEGNRLSKGLLRIADRQGPVHPIGDLVNGPAMQKLMSDPGMEAGDIAQFTKWNENAIEGKGLRMGSQPNQGRLVKAGTKIKSPGQGVLPSTVDRMRERYADEARGVFANKAEGEYTGPARGLRQRWAEAMASDLRGLNHNLLGPTFSNIEGKISDLINLKTVLRPVAKSEAKGAIAGRALTQAGLSGVGAAGGALVPGNTQHRLETAALGAALLSPAGLQNIARLAQWSPTLAPYISALIQGGKIAGSQPGEAQ